MRTISRALIVAVALGMPVMAQAKFEDRNGAVEMIRGDTAAAEQLLVAERRLFPDHVDLTLNLASLYQRAGRISDARALYRDVLRRPDEQVDLSNARSYSSHALAGFALRRIDRTQLTAR